MNDKPGDIESYFKEYDDLLAQLTSIGSEVPEEDQIQHLVDALPKTYDPIVFGMMGFGLPSLLEIQATVMFEESKRQMRQVSMKNTEESLLVWFQRRNQLGNFKSYSETINRGNSPVICHYCGRPGHFLS